MSLVKSKRDPSDIQYYHTCLQIHRQIAQAINIGIVPYHTGGNNKC